MYDYDAYLLSKAAERVVRNSSGLIQLDPQFCEKVPCKGVTVGQSECARVQHHLLVDVEMVNVVELVIIWRRQRDTVATNKCS